MSASASSYVGTFASADAAERTNEPINVVTLVRSYAAKRQCRTNFSAKECMQWIANGVTGRCVEQWPFPVRRAQALTYLLHSLPHRS